MKVPPFKKAGSPRVLASLGLKSDSLLDLAESISQDILQRFYPAFVALTATLSQLQDKQQ